MPFGAGLVRLSPLTTPVVTVPSKPYGLPIAITGSPTRTSARARRSRTAGVGESSDRIATSVLASSRRTVASDSAPSWKRTVCVVAPSRTCVFVTITPALASPSPGVTAKPEPLPEPRSPETRTSTTATRTCSTRSGSVSSVTAGRGTRASLARALLAQLAPLQVELLAGLVERDPDHDRLQLLFLTRPLDQELEPRVLPVLVQFGRLPAPARMAPQPQLDSAVVHLCTSPIALDRNDVVLLRRGLRVGPVPVDVDLASPRLLGGQMAVAAAGTLRAVQDPVHGEGEDAAGAVVLLPQGLVLDDLHAQRGRDDASRQQEALALRRGRRGRRRRCVQRVATSRRTFSDRRAVRGLGAGVLGHA